MPQVITNRQVAMDDVTLRSNKKRANAKKPKKFWDAELSAEARGQTTATVQGAEPALEENIRDKTPKTAQEKADAALKFIKATICLHSVDVPFSKRLREKWVASQAAYYADVRDGKNLSDALFTASPGSAPLPGVHKLTIPDDRSSPERGIWFNHVGDLFDFPLEVGISDHRRLLGKYYSESQHASLQRCGALPDAKYLMMLGVYMECEDRSAFITRWSYIRGELKEYFPSNDEDGMPPRLGSLTRDIRWFFDRYNGNFNFWRNFSDFWRNPVPGRDYRPRYVCVNTEDHQPVELRGPPGLLRLAPPAPESQSDTGDIHGDIDISMPMYVNMAGFAVLCTGNSNVLRSGVQRDLCPMKIPIDDAHGYTSAETESATTSISSSSRSPSSSR